MATRPCGRGTFRSGALMRYQEHLPHPALHPFVECYWSIRGAARDPVVHQVLPDGCLDLLFDLSLGAAVPIPNHPEAAVVGCMTRPLPVEYRGQVALFAVRFRPGCAAGFLRADARELTNRVAALADLWGAEGTALFEALAASGSGAGDPVRVMDEALLDRLEKATVQSDALMVEATARIVRSGGRMKVADLARSLGISRRQLERRFPATAGTSPKTAARVARFRQVVDALHARPSDSLSRLALRQGYADQAHMTREFKALAGRSPGVYRRARLD